MKALIILILTLFIGQFIAVSASSFWHDDETCHIFDLEEEDGEHDSQEDSSETEKKEINHIFNLSLSSIHSNSVYSNGVYAHYCEVYDEVTIGTSSPPPKFC